MADETQTPIVTPNGDVTQVPAEQAPDLLNAGYAQPSQQQLSDFAKTQHYSTTGQQIATGLEGAASAATFGGSTKLETLSGLTTPEDIENRAEINPGVHGIGEAAGLVGTNFIPGYGEYADAQEAAKAAKTALSTAQEGFKAGQVGTEAVEGAKAASDAASHLAETSINPLSAQSVMSGLGARGATALGFVGDGTISKIGSMAVKGAIENGIFQAGDEASKMFYGDPNAGTQTSLANVGLSALVGGGIGLGLGAASPLWDATAGKALGSLLEKFKDRVNGDSIKLPDDVQGALTDSGMQLKPEIQAGMSGVPEIDKQFNILREASTDPALSLQKSITDFQNDSNNAAMEALGRKGQIPGEVSAAEAGNKVKDQLVQSLESKFGPISDDYDKLASRLKDVPITDADKSALSEQVAQKMQSEFALDPNSTGYKMGENIIDNIKNFATAEDVRKYKSLINDKAQQTGEFRGGKMYKQIFQDAQDNMLTKSLSTEAPAVIEKASATNAAYAQARGVIDDLNDRLHVGRYQGPGTFIKAVKDMTPESVVTRLSKTNDTQLTDLLANHAPDVLQTLKDNALDKMLYKASAKAPEGSAINLKELMKQLHSNSMSPEYRQSLLGDAETKLNGLSKLQDSLADYHSSNTAKHTEGLWSLLPSGALAAASLLLGHGAIAGAIIGQVGKYLVRDAPDAVRLGMLKFLGSEGEVNPGALRAIVNMAHNTIKGENMVNDAVKGLLTAGKEVLPQTRMPTEKNRSNLEKAVDKYNQDPQSLFENQGQTGYYSPGHAGAMGQVAAKAVSFLSSIKPSTDPLGPLNSNRVPNAFEDHEYRRALDVAEQPLVVLHHMKQGTMIPHDLVVLHSIYPDLANRMSQKILSQVAEMQGKGQTIPYQSRMGLSMFTGQNLDTSLNPQNLQMSMQNAPGEMQQQQQAQSVPQGTQKLRGGGKSLTKLATNEMTPLQQRASQKDMS